jgi:hypothetical protein
MSSTTRTTAPRGPSFFLHSAAPTAPAAAVLVSGRGLDGWDSSGACDRQHQALAELVAAA